MFKQWNNVYCKLHATANVTKQTKFWLIYSGVFIREVTAGYNLQQVKFFNITYTQSRIITTNCSFLTSSPMLPFVWLLGHKVKLKVVRNEEDRAPHLHVCLFYIIRGHTVLRSYISQGFPLWKNPVATK